MLYEPILGMSLNNANGTGGWSTTWTHVESPATNWTHMAVFDSRLDPRPD